MDPTRFSRFSEEELINLVEVSIGGAGMVFRGLSHSELDRAWVLHQLEMHLRTGLTAVTELQQRAIALQQSV